MVRSLWTGLLATLCILLYSAVEADAQFTFTALDGLPTAQTTAEGSLGSDAELVLVGAPGSFEYQGFNLSFDLASGESNVWGYVFRSASSGDLVTLMVVRLFAYQAFELGSVPFPIPDNLITTLDYSGTYANSNSMVGRLQNDTAFQKYRGDLPEAKPQFVSFSQLLNADSLNLPNGFPVGQGTWTISFGGSEDSTMTCFVASKTGEAFCRRVYGIGTSSVADERGNNVSMQVSPNPAGGVVRVSITGYNLSELNNCRLLLFNSKGEVVSDLTSSLQASRDGKAEFSVDGIPSGSYHCILVGSSVRQEVGIIVVE
ncbi:MAG: hypothetical protein KDD67_11425 [Ignavibacteriae bacterium]|nr:hypothetical protein [Ignavibacteriota bacterium]MCB9216597.1 hypothetical protein [Ignavibacteria bacterium]